MDECIFLVNYIEKGSSEVMYGFEKILQNYLNDFCYKLYASVRERGTSLKSPENKVICEVGREF